MATRSVGPGLVEILDVLLQRSRKSSIPAAILGSVERSFLPLNISELTLESLHRRCSVTIATSLSSADANCVTTVQVRRRLAARLIKVTGFIFSLVHDWKRLD